MDGIVVFSTFDGMSCGQMALERAGVKVSKYYASEIKPHAITITQENYPDTVQLGDITKIKSQDLPKVDLFIGGSPCQDLSRGHSDRDGLDGEKSMLFWEYVRLYKALKEKNPKIKFLLENVIMPLEDKAVINDIFDTEPLRINSSLVSAQLRDRLYWTNIGAQGSDLFGRKHSLIPQPVNKNINLKDILDSGYTDRQKSRALLESDSRPLKTPKKMWHRYHSTGFTTLVFEDKSCDWEKGVRYLNQNELERLQTVTPGYTKSLTRNHAACLLGDGWTVDTVAHIFKELKHDKT